MFSDDFFLLGNLINLTEVNSIEILMNRPSFFKNLEDLYSLTKALFEW